MREEGHAADVAGTGEDALWMARAVDYDAIVLDVMSRESTAWRLPLIALGGRLVAGSDADARDAYADRITGLDVGADD